MDCQNDQQMFPPAPPRNSNYIFFRVVLGRIMTFIGWISLKFGTDVHDVQFQKNVILSGPL